MSLLRDRVFLASVVFTVALLAFFRQLELLPLTLIPVSVGLVRGLLPALRRRVKYSSIDLPLLFLLHHMYAVSTGRPPRKRLFELNCLAGSYGEYDRVLRKISSLAVDWGYGFIRAIRLVASRDVRNRVFGDFLLRLSEVLRTGEDPSRFLNVELSAMRRGYQSSYFRSIDIMRITLGLHTTLTSSTAFIITVMAILMLFTGGSLQPYVLSIIGSALAVAFFTAVLYLLLPKERLTPQLKPKPRHLFRVYNLSTALSTAISLAASLTVFYLTNQLEYVLLAAGSLLTIPGLVATRIESRLKRIESFYSVYIRGFGLTYSVIPNYAKALHSLLATDFGPLTKHIAVSYAKLSNGIDPRVVWRHFIYDTWSDLIARSTNVVVDAVDSGGNLREVGITLSETITRIMDLRNLRERTARTFEATTYVVQALASVISLTVVEILRAFSSFIQQLAVGIEMAVTELPFLFLSPEELTLITNITILYLVFLAVVNAIAVKIARGGMIETFWIPLSLMLAITSGSSIVVRLLVSALFGELLVPITVPT
ncbi:MAG: type II secretion system F family protein [Sulfolobales archaeon]|nr:type II secretion system F family protein [Sulfolobales archaeon]MDW8083022.1 type II secretion system F family protein [Sulfolobales archaeon]